jgi:hypothetical protein
LKYIIEAFDKKTEFLAFKFILPDGYDSQLAQIMGWTLTPRGGEGYDMTMDQITAIEVIAGRPFYDDAHIFQITSKV